MYSYFFVHTLHCMGFQWVLGEEERGKKGGSKGRWWDRKYRVWTVCCVSDAAVTYARDRFCWFSGGPFVLSRGGGQTYWHQAYKFMNNLRGHDRTDSEFMNNLRGRDRTDIEFMNNLRGHDRTDIEFMNNLRGRDRTDSEFMNNLRGRDRTDIEFMNNLRGHDRTDSEFMNNLRGRDRTDSEFMNNLRGRDRTDSEFMNNLRGRDRTDSEFMNNLRGRDRTDSEFMNNLRGRDRTDSEFMNGRHHLGRFCSRSLHLWRHWSGYLDRRILRSAVCNPHAQNGDRHYGQCSRQWDACWAWEQRDHSSGNQSFKSWPKLRKSDSSMASWSTFEFNECTNSNITKF